MKSKKNLIVFSLVSLLFINYIGTHLMYGLYMIDQSLFIELFCENKDHPDEECDGSCMLGKMGEHDHSSSDSSPVLDVYKIQLVFYIPYFQPEIPDFKQKSYPFSFYKNLYRFELPEDNLRPPAFV